MQVTTTKDVRKTPKKYLELQKELSSTDRKAKFVMYLFSEGPREYDFLLKILSMGRDTYWRNSMVEKARVPQGGRVLDIACGTGLVSYQFASRGNSVVGIDVTREMLRRALNLRESNAKQDVDLIQARAENLPLRSNVFDCATISLATRNVSNVSSTFQEMGRCIKRGGPVISMDFTRPGGRVFGAFYNFYTHRVLPALGMVISRHWNGIFSYLAGSIDRSKTPEQLSQIMKRAGLENVEVKRMTHGVTALVTGYKIN
ncbi:MAG TPA: ubiquinone/menaquinone biosynthesis methyltransferase [Nitrososphaerales archaeon]|nr:ubiquinone/menaquinone biosynthesis methyltransferase [Nitrososphaerales archaeon]